MPNLKLFAYFQAIKKYLYSRSFATKRLSTALEYNNKYLSVDGPDYWKGHFLDIWKNIVLGIYRTGIKKYGFLLSRNMCMLHSW